MAAILGSRNRAIRNRRPRHNEIDRDRTIRANLRRYQPDYRTIIPETRIGHGRKKSALREIVPCVDQSGPMATSVVYAGILGVVLASLPAVKTHVVVFDTSVVDLTEELDDPVDVLIRHAARGRHRRQSGPGLVPGTGRTPPGHDPGPDQRPLRGGQVGRDARAGCVARRLGVQMVAQLALSDEGAPSYDHHVAQLYAQMGIPAFACTPDLSPELMVAVINRQDLDQWAAARDIVAAGAGGP
jgi:hypothetical protein